MFKLGDRVRCTCSSSRFYNKIGTVVVIRNSYGIAFDENTNGHNLGGRCRWGHGQWFRLEYLELIKEAIHVCHLVCNCDAKKAMLL